jgi:hypothetical protein
LETNEAVEELKKFVLEHSLPKTEMALFGILCPYCGKSDRIRQLENPQALAGKIESENMALYFTLWDQLARGGGSLGVCKFCQNLLLLRDMASAVPLYE